MCLYTAGSLQACTGHHTYRGRGSETLPSHGHCQLMCKVIASVSAGNVNLFIKRDYKVLAVGITFNSLNKNINKKYKIFVT